MALAGSLPTPAPYGPGDTPLVLTATGTRAALISARPKNWCGFEVYNSDASSSVWLGGATVAASGTTTLGREIKAGTGYAISGSAPDLWYVITGGGSAVVVVTPAVAS